MTIDEIIKLAREADRWATNQTSDPYEWKVLRDERFATLIRNATLEECASEFDGQYTDSCPGTNISAAIRAMKRQA